MSDNTINDFLYELPHGETEFTNSDTGGNATKIVFDDERNKPFIAEFNQKLKMLNEGDGEALKAQFKAMTGIDFDDIKFDKDGNEIIDIKPSDLKYIISYDNDMGARITEIVSASDIIMKEDTKYYYNGRVCITVDKVISEDTPTNENEFNVEENVCSEEEKTPLEEADSNTVNEELVADANDSPLGENIVKNLCESSEKLVSDFEETGEDREYSEEILNQLDRYINDIDSLKFSEEEMEKMARIGIMDYETIVDMCQSINEEIDFIKEVKDEEDSVYHTEEGYKEAVLKLISLKVDTEQLIKASDELLEPETINRVYNFKYPLLATKGTTFILDQFKEYLEHRMEPKSIDFLIYELCSVKKIDAIFTNAQERLFNHLKTKDDTLFTIDKFFYMVFHWNKERLSTLTGIPMEEIKIKKFNSLLVTFSALFLRFLYKHVVHDLGTRSLQKRLLLQFFIENGKPESSDIENMKELLNKIWSEIWEICNNIVQKTIKEENASNATKAQLKK
jgi:hypothetical protein